MEDYSYLKTSNLSFCFLLLLYLLSIDKIRGFTKEMLVALATNSREWRRRLPHQKHEHPRSGTFDDVECFF